MFLLLTGSITKKGEVLECIWFRNLTSKTGAIVHAGDNRKGEGDGDKETVFVSGVEMLPRLRQLALMLLP